MNKSGLIFITCISLLSLSYGQGIDVFYFGTSYYPKRPLEANDSTEVRLLEYKLRLNILQRFKSDSSQFFVHGLRYDRFNPVIDRPNRSEEQNNLHSITYSLTWIKRLNKKWRLAATAMPTLSSQFKSPVSGKDLLFQGTILATNKKSDTKQLGYGVVYTSRLGRQLAIPMFQYAVSKPKMYFNLLFPFKVVLEFRKVDKSFRFGFDAGLNGGVFNFNDRQSPGAGVIDEVGFSRMLLGTYVSRQLKGPFYITLSTGMAVSRTYEFIGRDDQVLEDLTQKPGSYINLALSMTFFQ